MKQLNVLFVLAIAMTMSGCSLFGGDDGDQDLSTQEQVTPLATPETFVQPADDPATTEEGGAEASAPLPTAVTLPATPIPPEPTVDRSQPSTYVVQGGDVLGLIAERFDVDIAELRRVNGLSGNLIKVGQELTIPAAGGAEPPDETASPGTTPTSPPSAPTTAPAPVSCGAGAVGHCVQPGDSLLGIASQYGITVDELRSANPAVSGDFIAIGDLLTIPGGDPAPAPTTDPGTGVAPTSTPSVIAPQSDADCAALNPGFPFFHAADGLCYANPIGGATPIPTSENADPDLECPDGTFLWDDGLCYPLSSLGPTSTPDPNITPTEVPTQAAPDYGRPPCRAGYVELENNTCWPEPSTVPATVTPTS